MLRRSAGPFTGRLLRALESSSAASACAASPSAALAPCAVAALPAASLAFRRSFAAGPADVGLPRPPQVPSGMVPDADGMLPTTAALKNPSADIL